MSTSPAECDLLIRNAMVVTMDKRRMIYRDGAIAISGTDIAMVGQTRDVAARYRGKNTIDADGAPVHPGFVDAHFHIPNQLTRGVFPEKAQVAFFNYYSSWYDAMDADYEHAAALAAGLEMLRNGVTCYMEPGTVFETDAVAAAAEAVGVRATLGEPFLWDAGQNDALSHMKRVRPDTERCLDLLGKELWRNDNPAALVRGHVCIFGSGSASDELTKAASGLAAKSKAAFTQHQNTRISEVRKQESLYNGQYPLLHLAEIGALGPHCAFTHMNLIRDEEAAVIKQSGLSMIWCAAGSMNWGFGGTGHRRPHAALFREGVNIAIASDVPKWGLDAAPMITFLLSRDGGGADPLSAEDIFEMATLGSARAVGMEHMIGSLEAGKRADIVIRTTDVPEYQPGYYPIQNLLMTSRGRSVDTVIVNGDIVIRGGHSTRVDEHAVGEGARRHATRLADIVGIKPEESWPVQ